MRLKIPENITPLAGHTDFDSAYKVYDYPYSGVRTTMKFWLEYKPRHGNRLVMCSLNPKTGQYNKPHASTYLEVGCMYKENATGHIHWLGVHLYADKADMDLFETAFSSVLTDDQKRTISQMRDAGMRQSPQSYWGLTDEETAAYKEANNEIMANNPLPTKDNPDYDAVRTAVVHARMEARKNFIHALFAKRQATGAQ